MRSSAPTADALKTAVLAGLLLADEVLRKQESPPSSQEEAEIAQLTEKHIQTLDECLVSDSRAHTSKSFE